MVPKQIGSKVVRETTIHRRTSTQTCAYWYEMEFHAYLSPLGFGGVSLIYWIKESKHAIIYTRSKHACIDFQEPKGDTIWTKTPSKPIRHTQECDLTKGVQIVSNIQINTWKVTSLTNELERAK